MDIDDALESELNIKIIKFFHENQNALDTPRGIATWIREDRAKVKKALEGLVELGILIAHRATSTTGYSYTRNTAFISRIEKRLKKKKIM